MTKKENSRKAWCKRKRWRTKRKRWGKIERTQQQWAKCSQVEIQQESYLQVNTPPNKLIGKEERDEEGDKSLSSIFSLITNTSWCDTTPQGHWIEDSKKIGLKMQEKAQGFSWALG